MSPPLFIVASTGEDIAVRYKKEGHGVQRVEFIPRQAGIYTEIVISVHI